LANRQILAARNTRVDGMGFFGNGVDVGREPEGDDVGLQAIDDGAGLLTGASVRLFNGHGFQSSANALLNS
jgi:hypothetical protein